MPRALSIPTLLLTLTLVGTVAWPGRGRGGPVGAAAPGQVGLLTLVAQLGGSTDAVWWQGGRAVAGVGANLVVLDTTSGASPSVLGQVVLPGVVRGLAVGGNRAYVAAGYAGLQVVDLADPRAPRVVGSLVDVGGAEAWDVFLDGGRVYLAERSDIEDRLSAVDVSDPSQPRAVGSYSPLLGGIADADVAAGVAYLVDGEELMVVSFADPAVPRELGSFDTPGEANYVSVGPGHAYVVDAGDVAGQFVDALRVVDVANPAAPIEVGAFASPGIVRDLSAVGGRVYLLESGGLRIVDVSDATRPAERGTLALAGGALAAGVDAMQLAVGLAAGGLAFVDATNPVATRVTGTWVVPGAPHDVAVVGDRLYQLEKHNATGLRLVGVADPARPVTLGYVGSPGEGQRLAADERHAYVADGLAGLQVADAADPARPQWVGAYPLAQDARGVALVGDRVYLAAGQDGLGILSIVDPTKPRSLGSYDNPGDALGVAVAGDRAFVAEVDMIRAVDVSDPRATRPLGAITLAAYEGNMTLAGDRLYVPTADGLVVVDVANPAAMRELGRLAFEQGANDVAVDGGRAWVTSPAGVHEVDLARLAVTAEYFTPAYAEGVAVQAGRVYVAAYEAGLFVLAAGVAPTPPPPTPTGSATPGTSAPTATATVPSGRTPTGTPATATATAMATPTGGVARYRAHLPVAFRNR